MLLIEEELKRLVPERDTVLAVGVFDGVHLGHQQIIARLRERAATGDFLAGVVTFRQHPERVFTGRTVALLTTLAERVRLLRSVGVELVATLSFTPALAGLPALEFVNLLQKYMRMRGLIIGEDFALGRGREGDIDMLRHLSQGMGFSLEVVPPKMIDGEVVSSSSIRQALVVGNISKVNKFLGRPFSLRGQVILGREVGRTLGFPTANLSLDAEQALPADGVYATWAYPDQSRHLSVTNIGIRPTFGGGERTVEVFILDFHGNLYGGELKIEVVQRIRDEVRFDTPEDLKAQVAKDIEKARKLLKKAE